MRKLSAHNDTWYFVFMNGYAEEGITINVSIRYTKNYYGFPPPPAPLDPDSDPYQIPEPDLTTFLVVISLLVGFMALGLTGSVILIKKRNKSLDDTEEGIIRG